MTNIEKYKDKLIELDVININRLALKGGIPHKCSDNFCNDCDFKNSEDGCFIYGCKKWLFSEYKEPKVDWSKVKVDTPILIRDTEDDEWGRRYFAKFEDGLVYTFRYGRTSWTAKEDDVIFWKFAKLAESEE